MFGVSDVSFERSFTQMTDWINWCLDPAGLECWCSNMELLAKKAKKVNEWLELGAHHSKEDNKGIS